MIDRLRSTTSFLPPTLTLLLLLAGCGRTASTESGNTNWLHTCDRDAECPEGACLCGRCATTCVAASCAEAGEPMCTASLPLEDAPGPAVVSTSLEADAFINDMSSSHDGSTLYVAGGHGQKPVGPNAVAYPDFWLQAYEESGSSLWQVRLPEAEEESNAWSVTETAEGSVVTVSERFVDGPRGQVRSFSADGEFSREWTVDPTLTRIHSARDGRLLGAGSGLVEWRDGRPFTRAVLGVVSEDHPFSPSLSHSGLDGSVSGVVDSTVSAAGLVALAGYSGNDASSNRSHPWLALADASGALLWSHDLPEPDGHCRSEGVSIGEDGSVLVVGHCGGNWLRAYSSSGTPLWERRLPHPPASVIALSQGYAVGLMHNVSADDIGQMPPGYPRAVLLRFDEEHRLKWRVTLPDCQGFSRLLKTDGGLVAAANCTEGARITRYEDTPL